MLKMAIESSWIYLKMVDLSIANSDFTREYMQFWGASKPWFSPKKDLTGMISGVFHST